MLPEPVLQGQEHSSLLINFEYNHGALFDLMRVYVRVVETL